METTTNLVITEQSAAPDAQLDKSTATAIVLPARFDAFTVVELPQVDTSEDSLIVLDAQAVQFVDMQALQSLVDARLEVLDAGGDLIVASPSAAFTATLELTGFDVLLDVRPTETTQRQPEARDLGIDRTGEHRIKFHGELGPAQADPLRAALEPLLSAPRPHVEVDLVGVTSLHLGIVNVLVAARETARERGGDINVTVAANSHAQHVLARVAIVGTIRP